MLFSPFFKHEIHALCFQSLYSFKITSTAITFYEFTADPQYINSVHAPIFCLSFSLSARFILVKIKRIISSILSGKKMKIVDLCNLSKTLY